jgi:hypothetical protein
MTPGRCEGTLAHVLLAACGGFLTAVLWFDLMFDVQVVGHVGVLPDAVRASIGGYYRRVTTDAHPMQRLIGAVMLTTLVASLAVLRHRARRTLHVVAMLLAWAPIGLAAARVFPNAVRLGAMSDDPAVQSQLARAIFTDHVFCLVAMVSFTTLQVACGVRWRNAGRT